MIVLPRNVTSNQRVVFLVEPLYLKTKPLETDVKLSNIPVIESVYECTTGICKEVRTCLRAEHATEVIEPTLPTTPR